MADSRYYSGRPEGRRLAPDRSSKDYGVSERRSAEKVSSGGVIPISTETYVTPSTRSSAYAGSAGGAYAGRPRRNTLDLDSGSHSSAKPRTVVTHQNVVPRAASPLARSSAAYDRDSAYVTASSSSRSSQPKREHKRLYSVDDSGHAQSVHNLPATTADPHTRNMDSWGGGADDRRERDLRKERRDHPRERERQYHLSGSSSAKARNIDESAYGYTDAAGMFRDTEPRWRSRRGSADARNRERPISMMDSGAGYDYSAHRPSRDMGPPVSTRGFDKINQGLERGSSVRDTRETRGSSRERRESDAPKYLGIDRAATFDLPARPSSARPPAESDPRNQHRLPADQRYDLQGDRYDERSYRQSSREPRAPDRQFTDQNLETRGFGIRTGSVDYGGSSRDESRDRRPLYVGGPPPVIDGERAPTISDYVPSHVLDDGAHHHTRRASDREDFRERARERYYPEDEYDDDRLRAQHDSRHGSVQSGDAHSRHGSVQGGLGAAASAAGVGLGAYAGKRAAEDRSKERRYDDEDDGDRPRRPLRDDPRDLDDRSAAPGLAPDHRDRDVQRDREPERDRERERNREKERERDRRRQQEEDFERDRERERERERQRPRDRERSIEEKPLAIEDTKAGAEQLDPDEEYRRRVQQAAAELAGVAAPPPREPAWDDERSRRNRDLVTEPAYPPPRRSREDMAGALPPRGSKDGLAPAAAPAITAAASMPVLGSIDRVQPPPAPVSDFDPSALREDQHNSRPRQESFFADRALSQEPTELALPPAPSISHNFSDQADAWSAAPARSRSSSNPSKDTRVRIVEPPKEEKESPPLKGILKKPKERFPEDPNPVREGVTTTKDPKRDSKARKEGIPSDARWTKIDRSWVNPQALEEAGERFEERMDCVIVLRVLTKNEIQKYADRTRQIRDEREGNNGRHSRRKHGDGGDDDGRHRERRGDRAGHDRGGRGGGKKDSDYYDSSDEEYERKKREYADLERSLRREKDRPKQIEMGHER